MSHADTNTIPVCNRWIGSWQVRIARRPLTPEALAAAYDRAAPGWTRLTERLGFPRAYRRVFEDFFAAHSVVVGDDPLRVLDCGTGTGAFSLALASVWGRPIEVSAVDVSAAMVDEARLRFRRAGVAARVLQAGVGALPFADSSLDLVLGAHVLEHLPEPVPALIQMRRVLRPGGWAIACMTRQSMLGAYIQTKWRTHRLTPERADDWLRDAGFTAGRLGQPPRGLFRLTSIASIGHNGHAGGAGPETRPCAPAK